MPVRDATLSDIDQLVDLIEAYYKEAPFEAPPVNRDKAAFVLTAVITNIGEAVFAKVIDVEGVVVGCMYAERVTDVWSDAHRVVESFLYVHPDFRKRPSAGKLMLQFADWAQQIPSVVRVEASMGIDDAHAAKVFERLGYGPRGSLHGMEAY